MHSLTFIIVGHVHLAPRQSGSHARELLAQHGSPRLQTAPFPLCARRPEACRAPTPRQGHRCQGLAARGGAVGVDERCVGHDGTCVTSRTARNKRKGAGMG